MSIPIKIGRIKKKINNNNILLSIINLIKCKWKRLKISEFILGGHKALSLFLFQNLSLDINLELQSELFFFHSLFHIVILLVYFK